ncbi:hypothetical protein KQ940_16545 [Marinobacterium sp. D7]|uniref:hypothetical protein n=1 Tax=Marinobacterium ramblicola TaxID=2849041 RepID=UPI001C2CE656|nr:hypothetical protein [Marinobacterium ramblicola]MBV1789665.1 hypothetical protein [Marinobacterium ramblicola]
MCSLQGHASETIQLVFQQPLQDKTLESIAVEIGGYDVTPFIERTEDGVSVSLDSGLEAGTYQAYVLAFYSDGEIQTLTESQVTILAPSSTTEWSVNSTLSTQVRVAEDDNTDYRSVDHRQTNGALSADSDHRDGSLHTSARVQAVYDSLHQGHSPDSEWQLADYQASIAHEGESGSAGMSVGSYTHPNEDLLFSGYQRRGVNLYANNDEQTLKASVFGTASETTNSTEDDLFWPEKQNNQTLGGTLAVSPLADDPERLTLTTSYVDGKGRSTGSGFTVLDDESIYGGHSWGITLDSIWLNRSLWLHWQKAQSSFDSDGLDYGDGALDDDADKWLVQLNSGPDLPAFGVDQWQLSAQRQRVGERFYSIANLGLPGDLDTHQLALYASKGGLSLNAEGQHQQNNIEDHADRATLTVRYFGLDLNYTPSVDLESGLWRHIGSPTYTAYYHVTRNNQPRSDVLLSGVDVDNTQHEYSLGANFSHQTWSWGVSYALVKTDDRSDPVEQNAVEIYTPVGDTENHLTSLQLSWFPNERLTLSPTIQWNRYKELENDNEYTTLNTGIDSQYAFIPNKLLMNVNYFYGRYDNQYGDPNNLDTRQDNHTGNLQLTWKAVEAKDLRPGMDWFLKGNYGRQDDTIDANDYESWQVRLGFSLYWAGNNEG